MPEPEPSASGSSGPRRPRVSKRPGRPRTPGERPPYTDGNPVLAIRLTPAQRAAVLARGGSTWAREVLLRELPLCDGCRCGHNNLQDGRCPDCRDAKSAAPTKGAALEVPGLTGRQKVGLEQMYAGFTTSELVELVIDIAQGRASEEDHGTGLLQELKARQAQLSEGIGQSTSTG